MENIEFVFYSAGFLFCLIRKSLRDVQQVVHVGSDLRNKYVIQAVRWMWVGVGAVLSWSIIIPLPKMRLLNFYDLWKNRNKTSS